ncbi:MAG: radical SAM protein [Clostridiales bacterium]|nr:radical SAM protein [Clostridiales bacterium]MBF0979523.1 radical SAM protein [Clostridiales bacterium]
MDLISKCEICPRKCKVNRYEKKGYCRCDDKVRIALVSKHYFEEPCISGRNGSGTIFFSNCNLNCIFCQNHDISQGGKGIDVTIERLAEIMLEQQERGANNINLVTPTMYVEQIIKAIDIAKKNGLNIPIVYNTNGYEEVETIKKLNGYIDIYLPDFKYFTNELAIKYSKAPNYFEKVTSALIEMQSQFDEYVFDGEIMKKGMIVRHLVLPNHIQNSKNVLKWIKDNLRKDIYVSVMAQYFPTYKAIGDELIGRKLSFSEYRKIEQYFYGLDIENGYIQDLGKHEEEFVPDFNMNNVI